MKHALFILIACLAPSLAPAQYTMHKLLTAGYEYQNQSFAEVGGKLLFLKNDDFIFRTGVSGLFGECGGKFVAMPKLQGDILINTERGVDFYHSYYFLAGAELTTKYVAPKIGATLAGLLDVTAGYAFPIGRISGKTLKGFNLGITFNIPTVFIHDYFH